MNQEKHRLTNSAWNSLTLNDPWSVGYVARLMEHRRFMSEEDWSSYYFESGKERAGKLKYLRDKERLILEDHTLKKTNPHLIYTLKQDFQDLNTNSGRTKECLMEKAFILFDYVKKTNNNIDAQFTLTDCQNSVLQRVLHETWVGFANERDTIEYLKTEFKSSTFKKVSAECDYQYAVDFEMIINGNAFCGIQIKPMSYRSNNEYVNTAKESNSRKNAEYINKFKRPVVTLISENGKIHTTHLLSEINKIYLAAGGTH